jgi:hypothetical protein
MSTYETLLAYLAVHKRIKNIHHLCTTGQLPMSDIQARRCIRRAQERGEVIITCAYDEHGQPLIVEVNHEHMPVL